MNTLLILIAILIGAVVSLSYTLYKKGSFLDNLTWRRSVKNFSPGSVDTEPIKQAIINSPSSFGLQPYTVIVVENQDIKKKLREVCFDQAQIEECSSLFVFCAFCDVESRIEEYLTRTKAEHLRPIMARFFDNLPDKLAWCKHQAYIALGFGLAAAAEKKITTCPMEGFIPGKVAEILGLDDNLVPSVLLTVGKEGDNSKLPPRFRFNRDELITKVQ